MPAPLLSLTGAHKHFRGVPALRGASLDVLPGEVHGLIGQNGAGKSTIIKIVTGVYRFDERDDRGELSFAGRPLRFAGPGEARRAGISTIYQEVNLVPQRSVAENIFLGREPRRFGLIDWRRIEREATAVLAGFGFDIDVRRAVGALSTAEQQLVAIARAASVDARLVIMDECTSSLDEHEVDVLFSIVRQLKAAGRSVLFVSHRLEELFAVCDRVTVMRDGQTVVVSAMKDVTRLELVTAMLGKELSAVHRARRAHAGPGTTAPALLTVSDMEAPPRLRHASLTLQPGETLGLAGLLGAGRTELMRAVFGADPIRAGEVVLQGERVSFASPADAIARGIGYLSEDRKTEGIFADLSVRENITIALLPALAHAGVIDRARQHEVVARFVAQLGIRTAHLDQPVRELSGGNQQKVLLARWLAMQPRVLMLDEPTRGVDVGAKADIARLIGELADGGMGLLLTASELEELVALSDAAVVVREGRTVARIDGGALDERTLMAAMAESDAVAASTPETR